MTYSETKFRGYLKKAYNDLNIYIRKLPDKKQTGLSTGLGLPDYLVISKGKIDWFEVKQVKDKKYNINTFNLNNISDSQYIEFTKMTNAGANIYIAIYLNKELYIVPYDKIQFAKYIGGETSIHKIVLEKWRPKWNQPSLQ
jgi:penicillin-binding protein-related factor A (putative recombinase)